eukprot:TRINITY_DN2521_c0_g2_i3.p1 TRINITY_DN2521_c0_g2~~TRINITY_DN2521_c0_g2_i3.p1  ORF type:complete len:170 (+),score=24.74 TRINITY_DN2521_c0_g2_i3:443-952(+)
MKKSSVLMDRLVLYQNSRGGKVIFRQLQEPLNFYDKGTLREAYILALKFYKEFQKHLLQIHRTAKDEHDAHLMRYIEGLMGKMVFSYLFYTYFFFSSLRAHLHVFFLDKSDVRNCSPLFSTGEDWRKRLRGMALRSRKETSRIHSFSKQAVEVEESTFFFFFGSSRTLR